MSNKKNLFEMGASFDDAWSADNKNKPSKKESKEILLPNKHQLHFAKEKRRGKVVTIVKPFYLDKKELSSVLKTIKKLLGTGGTIKENSMEFQGEIKEKLKIILQDLGFGLKK